MQNQDKISFQIASTSHSFMLKTTLSKHIFVPENIVIVLSSKF